MSKYYFCIDVGGTEIKGGIIDEDYKILSQDKINTNLARNEGFDTAILEIIDILEKKSGLKVNDSAGLGIALPGIVDGEKGIIKYITSLDIKEYNIVKKLGEKIKIPIKLLNDAEAALLSEHRLGAGKGLDNFALITLGTGVGLGVMINGKSIRSISPFGCEFGHNYICGTTDVNLDKFVSTRALINRTKIAMTENKNSEMWKSYTLEKVSGKTVFDYKDTDITAKKVFDEYIKNLGIAVVNLCNVFLPEIIVIGGGISKQGEKLTKPLEDFVNNHIFARNIDRKVKIKAAKFLNDAGILGARCLFD